MAGTGITVALIAVMIQIIYASKLMSADSHQLPEKKGSATKLNFIEAMGKVLQARNSQEKNLRQAKEKAMKRNSDPYHNIGGCYDNDGNCPYWASIGECSNNPAYMHDACKYSCDKCCTDDDGNCPYWASIGECFSNPNYMHGACQLSCELCPASIYYKRDVTRNLGNSPPGTRDDSHKELRADEKLKRAYELQKFIKKARTWSHAQGNKRPPGARATGSN